jgi:hypothetical protein
MVRFQGAWRGVFFADSAPEGRESMSTKRWMGLALVVAVALVGCKKKEAEQPPAPVAAPEQPPQPAQPAAPVQPAQPGTGTTAEPAATPTTPTTPAAPAPTAEESEKVLAALDGSVERLGAGFGAGLGGLMMAKRAAGGESMEPAAEPGALTDEQEAPPPISRMQVHFDLAALRSSPVGALLEGLMPMIRAKAAEDNPNAACLVDLLAKINTGFVDVTLGPDGEPSALVASIKSTATKDEVVNCMKGAADEGSEFVEVPVGDRTGYTMKEGEEPVKFVLVEATPGNWLFGMPPAVEAGLAADPEADATFQALSAPLGPTFARMTIVFKPEIAALASTIAADAPPQAQCVKNVLERLKGGSIGLRLAPDFTLAIAVQNGSATEASETQACLSTLWELVKPLALREIGPDESAQLQAMLGLTPAALLDLVKVEASAEFARVSLSLPGEVLAKLLQIAGQFAQMAAAGGGPGM